MTTRTKTEAGPSTAPLRGFAPPYAPTELRRGKQDDDEKRNTPTTLRVVGVSCARFPTLRQKKAKDGAPTVLGYQGRCSRQTQKLDDVLRHAAGRAGGVTTFVMVETNRANSSVRVGRQRPCRFWLQGLANQKIKRKKDNQNKEGTDSPAQAGHSPHLGILRHPYCRDESEDESNDGHSNLLHQLLRAQRAYARAASTQTVRTSFSFCLKSSSMRLISVSVSC